MLRVGLTGGIGSGKTTVARIFEVLGVPVYYADVAAKNIMVENPEVKAALTRHFGEEIFNPDGLDRALLSSIVFNDPAKLEMLNGIVHPATISHATEWMLQQTTPYIIKEAALIFEAGADKDLDYVVGVSSPLPLRIERVQARDQVAQEAIEKRMERQMNEDEKMKRCDFILYNNAEQLLLPQVLQLHEQLLALAANK